MVDLENFPLLSKKNHDQVFVCWYNELPLDFTQLRLMKIEKQITHKYLSFLRSLNTSGGTLVSLLPPRYLN